MGRANTRKIGAEEAVPQLIKLLDDETSLSFIQRVCDTAAEALQLIGSPDAMAAVEKWQRNRN